MEQSSREGKRFPKRKETWSSPPERASDFLRGKKHAAVLRRGQITTLKKSYCDSPRRGHGMFYSG